MKFRIGIAMAGAVSAGAYTAGAIDYLLDALKRWEEAKQKNRTLGEGHKDYDLSLPMHDVIIEVLGGASAGGMTAAIASLALFKDIKPVTSRGPKKGDNIIYDAWVNLNDNEKNLIDTTMRQLFNTDDIKRTANKSVPSLLNPKAIASIATKALKTLEEKESASKGKELKIEENLPPYISPELDIILSLCSLKGIPVDVRFESDFSADSSEDKKKKIHRTKAKRKSTTSYGTINQDLAISFIPWIKWQMIRFYFIT